MKIVICTDRLRGDNGWSRYAVVLANALTKRNHEVIALVEELTPESKLKQIQCFKDPLKHVYNPVLAFTTAMKVNKILAEIKPDILQFTTEPYCTIVPFLKKREYKIVLNAHSTFAYLPILVKGFKIKFLEFYTKLINRKVDAIVALSRYTREHIKKHMSAIGEYEKIKEKIELVGGALDTEAFPPEFIEKNNSPKNILFVGAVKPRKGVIEAIESLAFVKTDFMYNIVGPYDEKNPYVGQIREKIKALHLENRVRLLGRLSHEELKNLYKKSDLFLMLSTNNGADFEGYGLVYLEASNYGLPCIGPSDSGVADAIVDGKTGYLVDQYKPREVAVKIDDILSRGSINPKECIAWAQKNSTENQAIAFENIYKKIRA